MSSSDINNLRKLAGLKPLTESVNTAESTKQVLNEKYMGHARLSSELKQKGAKDPEGLASWIGREKYGKEKFQAAAAKGKKMGEGLARQPDPYGPGERPSQPNVSTPTRTRALPGMPFSTPATREIKTYKDNYGDDLRPDTAPIGEDDMEEGNLFTGNLAKARAQGKKRDDLDGDGDTETVREGAKPDFLDLNRNGNRKEPMKKAAADMKKSGVAEGQGSLIPGKFYVVGQEYGRLKAVVGPFDDEGEAEIKKAEYSRGGKRDAAVAQWTGRDWNFDYTDSSGQGVAEAFEDGIGDPIHDLYAKAGTFIVKKLGNHLNRGNNEQIVLKALEKVARSYEGKPITPETWRDVASRALQQASIDGFDFMESQGVAEGSDNSKWVVSYTEERKSYDEKPSSVTHEETMVAASSKEEAIAKVKKMSKVGTNMYGFSARPARKSDGLDSDDIAEQRVTEGSAHGFNVVRYYEKTGNQLKIVNWLRKEAGLPKNAPVYFDDADLVYDDKTIVPNALVNPNLKLNDLLTAVIQASGTGRQGKQNVGGIYRESNVEEGFKNTYNVGDRVDSPLGAGTIVAVSKNVNVDGRVKVKLDDPSKAGEDGRHKDSFVLNTTQLKHIDEQGVAEGYILKKTNVDKYMKPGDPDEYTQDINIKDTDYEIINNKTGQVVGTASWTTNDFMGPGALKITMKNGATRYLDIWASEKGNPQTAFNRFVKDPKTAKKYKEQGVAEGVVDDMPADSMVGTMDKIRGDAKSQRYHYLQKLLKQSKNPKTIAQIKALLTKELKQGVAEGSLKEFAPSNDDGGGGDDKMMGPTHYEQAVDFFSLFESDTFDKENMTANGWEGYVSDDDGNLQLAAGFKWDNPRRNGDDDPGIGWYMRWLSNWDDLIDNLTEGEIAEQRVSEETKETSTGRVHKAGPGGYGRRDDDEDDDKKKVKRGRGRPGKGADSETGKVPKHDTDTLSRWIVGSKPKDHDDKPKSNTGRQVVSSMDAAEKAIKKYHKLRKNGEIHDKALEKASEEFNVPVSKLSVYIRDELDEKVSEGTVQGGIWRDLPAKKGERDVPPPMPDEGPARPPAATKTQQVPKQNTPVIGTYRDGIWTADRPKPGQVGVPVPQNIDGGSAPPPAKPLKPAKPLQKKAELDAMDADTGLAEMMSLAGLKRNEKQLSECDMDSGSNMSYGEQAGRINVSTNQSSDGNQTITITADGDAADELAQMLKLSGMLSGDKHSSIDEEYANEPHTEKMTLDSMLHSGDDLHKEKASYSDRPYRGDNPMAESLEQRLWNEFQKAKQK